MKSRIWIYVIILNLVLLSACDKSKKAFENAKSVGTIEAYESFIANNPKSKYLPNAKVVIDSLRFQEVRSKGSRVEYKNFILKYPDSKFVEIAKAILDTLKVPFPQLSEKIKLSKGAHETYDKAKAAYPADQVSSAMLILDIRKTEKLSPQQMQWLETEFAGVEEHAKWILERDFEKASVRGDGRSAFTAFAALSNFQLNPKTQIDSLLARAPKLFATLLDSTAWNKTETLVWQVKDVGAELIGSEYQEKVFGRGEKVLTARQGHQLVRVDAQVQNVSDQSDPPYVMWALRSSQRAMLEMDMILPSRKVKEPNRLASSGFIFLIIEENQKQRFIPCEYVCESSPMLRGAHAAGLIDLIALISEGRKTDFVKDYGGSFAEKGEEFNVEILFHVPNTALKNKMKLMMLGAPPVELALGNSK